MTARWPAFAPALDRAAHHAREWLMSLAERPGAPAGQPGRARGGPRRTAARRADRARDGRRRARRRHRARADGDAVGPVLRLGHRRHAPGRARGGLAHERVGPEHGDAPLDAGRRGGGGRGRRVGARPARPAGRRRRRVRHRRHHGQLHRAGGGAASRCSPTRAGTSSRDGLAGGPRVRVLVGAERHETLDLALRYLGLGTPTAVAADDQGRLVVDDLERALAEGSGPTIVCLQAGNLHSGAFDPMAEAIEVAHRHGAWVHVDGAFGLWAAASPRLRRPASPATSAPTRGPPTRTRPSTCRTTAAWRSSRTPSRCAARSACTPSTSRRSAGRATRWRRCPSCPGAPAACRCGRCCGRSGAAGSRTWWTAWWRTPAAIADGIADDRRRRDPQRRRVHPGLRRVRLRRAHPARSPRACWPTA